MGILVFSSMKPLTVGGIPSIEDLPESCHTLVIFSHPIKNTSWIFARPKASFNVGGFNIWTGSLTSSLGPLKKQLSLCCGDKPLILFDNRSLVKASIGSSWEVVPNMSSKACTGVSHRSKIPDSSQSWYQTMASPSIWKEANGCWNIVILEVVVCLVNPSCRVLSLKPWKFQFHGARAERHKQLHNWVVEYELEDCMVYYLHWNSAFATLRLIADSSHSDYKYEH